MQFREIFFRGKTLFFENSSLLAGFFLDNYSEVEPENFDFIDSLKEDILMDLGACEGRYAIYSAVRGIRTFAVEPESKNFEALLTNAKLNKLNNLSCYKIATGRYDHDSRITIGQAVAAGHHKIVVDASSRSASADYGTESVSVKSLDSFVLELGITPTALKIDVDGSELDTLIGGLLTLGKINHLMIELQINDKESLDLINKSGLILKEKFQIVKPWLEPNLYNFWFVR